MKKQQQNDIGFFEALALIWDDLGMLCVDLRNQHRDIRRRPDRRLRVRGERHDLAVAQRLLRPRPHALRLAHEVMTLITVMPTLSDRVF